MLLPRVSACMLTCMFPLAALAAHPLVTEDTDEIGGKQTQLEITADHSVQRGVHHTTNVARATLTQGLTDALEVAISVPWMSRQRGDGPHMTSYGLGDTQTYLKLRIYQDDRIAFAIKEMFILPSGSQEKGLGKDRLQTAFDGILSWRGDRVTLLGNVGYHDNRNKDDERREILRASAAARVRVAGRWQVAAEVLTHSNYDQNDPRYQSMAGFGVIYSPLRSLDLDVGYHHGLNSVSTLYDFGAGAAYRW